MDIATYNNIMHENYFRAGVYHGVKDPQEDYTSGNHHVINAIHYVIMDKFKALDRGDRLIAEKFIEACRAKNGTFNRTPTKLEKEGQDDYIAIMASSEVLHLQYGIEIYNYGKQWRFPKVKVLGVNIPIPLKWYFDNTNSEQFDISYWHYRFIRMIALYKTSAGERANLFDQFLYSLDLLVDVYFNKDKTNTSERILQWLSNRVMKGKYWLTDWAIAKWEQNIKDTYLWIDDGEMGGVLSIYYGHEHPFAEIMDGRI